MRRRLSSIGLAVLLLAATASLATEASAFAIFRGFGATPADTLGFAARWTGTTGLDDGLQVGIDRSLASDLALAGEDPGAVEAAILAGFAPWAAANDAIAFEVEFDVARRSHHEIWLEARPGTDPVFGGFSLFGLADVRTRTALRTLTNGDTLRGFEIYLGFVYFNVDNLLVLGALGEELRRVALTRLALHEIGHVLGLGHPNDNGTFLPGANYDTDTDPTNPMIVDPADPYGAIIESPNRDNQAIMSNAPCGTPPVLCDAAFFTALRPDDLGGLQALYPAPEPGALVAWGLLLVGGWTRLRARGAQAGQTTD